MMQRRFVDLHTHTTASDGRYEPEELIRAADTRELLAIAVTDHDTTAGLQRARAEARRHPELLLIAGIEISAVFPDGTLHILGLGIDESNSQLQALLQRLRDTRAQRNPKIVEKLRDLGIDITMEDVLAETGRGDHEEEDATVGRLHIAQALCRKGVVRQVREAFDRYIGDGKPAFEDKERLSPREAIESITAAGGTAVLAHPVQLKYNNHLHLETTIRSLQSVGLGGIEVYHSDHSPEQTALYMSLARRLDLTMTGGSDFHGQNKPDVSLGIPRVPADIIGREWMYRLAGRTCS
ncbi:MAG: PHP domain-containing protein [Phycisphaerae bacterium]